MQVGKNEKMNEQMFLEDVYCKTFSYNSGNSNLSSDHYEENSHIFAMTSFSPPLITFTCDNVCVRSNALPVSPNQINTLTTNKL